MRGSKAARDSPTADSRPPTAGGGSWEADNQRPEAHQLAFAAATFSPRLCVIVLAIKNLPGATGEWGFVATRGVLRSEAKRQPPSDFLSVTASRDRWEGR